MTIATYFGVGLALVAVATAWPAVRRTTLVAPWCWLIAALSAAPWVSEQSDAARLITGTLTLCPGVALLGAKRPQDQAWQFIVATFWLVLALPGLQAWVLPSRGSIEWHPARAWFLVALVGFCTLNSLFGRFGWSVLLAAIGQVILLSPFLPWPFSAASGIHASIGWICVAIAVTGARGIALLRPEPPPSLNRLWADFRDAFGAVWTLRLAERLNETARQHGWGVSVSWDGFHGAAAQEPLADLSDDQRRAFRQSLANLLRRFVREEWINRRWNGS